MLSDCHPESILWFECELWIFGILKLKHFNNANEIWLYSLVKCILLGREHRKFLAKQTTQFNRALISHIFTSFGEWTLKCLIMTFHTCYNLSRFTVSALLLTFRIFPLSRFRRPILFFFSRTKIKLVYFRVGKQFESCMFCSHPKLSANFV